MCLEDGDRFFSVHVFRNVSVINECYICDTLYVHFGKLILYMVLSLIELSQEFTSVGLPGLFLSKYLTDPVSFFILVLNK